MTVLKFSSTISFSVEYNKYIHSNITNTYFQISLILFLLLIMLGPRGVIFIAKYKKVGYFPMHMDLKRFPCVVIGGGKVIFIRCSHNFRTSLDIQVQNIEL